MTISETNKVWMAFDKDGEKLKGNRTEAQIYRWAWHSDYSKDEIDIVAAPDGYVPK